jgi:ABC-type Na+ efflux pump permease subunit
MRALFALVAIIIGLFVYLGERHSPPQDFGEMLFGVLAFFSMFYCLTAGIRATADSLSEEKREGTLGLLFLTDLRGYDIVLGKMAATSLRGFYGLLAIFPVLALPLLVGGVTSGEFWRLVLVLLNTFFLSLAIGIFVSARSQHARKAMAGTLGLILLFSVIFPAWSAFIIYMAPGHKSQFANQLMLPCPFWSIYLSDDSHYRSGAKLFWQASGTLHGLTWCFLVLASLIAPRSWQDKPAKGGLRWWRELWHDLGYGKAAQRATVRRRLLDVNAFYWLAGRVRIKPAVVWVFIGLVGCSWAWGIINCGSEWFNEGVYFPTAILLNSMLKLWIASEAGRRLGEDRKIGALELVLSTPFTEKDILRGQWLALGRQFLGPVIFIVGMQVIFMAASLQRESFHDNPMNPMLWMAGIVMLLADMTALGWVAMSAALTAKNPNRITGMAVVRLLAGPWIAYVVIIIMISLVVDILGWYSRFKPHWRFFTGLWLGLGISADLLFGLTARWRVRNRFRELALQRFDPLPSRLMRWFVRRRKTVSDALPGKPTSRF